MKNKKDLAASDGAGSESQERGRISEHMRYFGVLGLLCECAVYVPDDIRTCIDLALTDACTANPPWQWRGILDRRILEIPAARPSSPDPSPQSSLKNKDPQ